MAQDDASLSVIQLLLRDFAAMTHSAPNAVSYTHLTLPTILLV